jgi:hypothetical protein
MVEPTRLELTRDGAERAERNELLITRDRIRSRSARFS